MLFKIVQTVVVMFGAVIVLVGICAGRTAAGRAQSAVLDFWVSCTSFGEQATGRHSRAVMGMARAGLSAIDWLFGRYLLRVRSLWTAAWLSFASANVSLLAGTLVVFLLFKHVSLTHPEINVDILGRIVSKSGVLIRIVLLLIAGCIGFAVFPALVVRPYMSRANLRAACVGALSMLLITRNSMFLSPHQIMTTPIRTLLEQQFTAWSMLAPFILIGVGSDLLVVFGMRWALRQLVQIERWGRGLAAIAVLVAVGFAVTGGLLVGAYQMVIHGHLHEKEIETIGTVLAISTSMNTFDILIVLFVVSSVAILMLHKLMWPLVLGPIERLYELIPSRAAVIGIGLLLLSLSPWSLGWVKEIAELVATHPL